MQLKRIEGALLAPIESHPWESQAVLNPGTIRDGDIVHMLYRAVEGDNYSAIGYAKLDRDGKILERNPEPVIARTETWESRGCEDPRIVKFEGTYYIFYSAYDGTEVRVCAASTRDFKKYTKHGIIIPDVWNKDALIFPERINGKIVLIHRIEPDIQFAYFDSMEELLKPAPGFWKNYIKNLDQYVVMEPEFWWEESKLGAGPPPIKTDKGWLLIYHGVDAKKVYRGGAALLDLNDPTKVLAKFPEPILEPIRKYELEGDVPNVVFPEGIAVFADQLIVYYAGGDKVLAMAECSLSEIVTALVEQI